MKRLIACSLALSLFACVAPADDADPTSADGLASIPAGFGKGDNYIATSAREYKFTGRALAKLPDGFEALEGPIREDTLDRAVTARKTELTRAAQRHVEKVMREANAKRLEENPLPEPDPNDPDAEKPEDPFVDYFIYVKPSYQGGTAGDVVVDGPVAAFDFEMEFVGANELIELVIGDDGDNAFDLEITGVDGNPTTLAVTVEASPSTDAFPRYDALFADEVYDIAIHFGGDYNEERYDIETAKWTVEYLIESGWEAPVEKFEDLRHDSGPFKMSLTAEGRALQAHVYVYHAQMDDDAGVEQSLLRELVETSVKERDVVIYSGHAGSNAGMILDYHPRFELDDNEFDDIEMRDDYQIFVFDGCNSYRTYVDALIANPAKTFENTDIVTTVNTTPFSAGYEIINRFVHWLTLTGNDGAHFPVSWNTLLRGVNDTYLDVHYGVHGIDQDPKLNPHAGGEFMCQSCDTNADCGAGANFCLNYAGGGACGVACTEDSACGDGFECIQIFDDPDLFYIPKQCVRSSLTCG